jgi:hypothetical protein
MRLVLRFGPPLDETPGHTESRTRHGLSRLVHHAARHRLFAFQRDRRPLPQDIAAQFLNGDAV